MSKNLNAFMLSAILALSSSSYAATLNIADAPLFLSQEVTPLTMLVLGRDHKLYFEAYNDYTDYNGDGVLDIRFKPTITYKGYFDPNKCYNYASGQYNPASPASGSLKTCAGNWSGNFLNYLTTSRMDLMRQVLYGGRRYLDSATDTVLERAYIPQDGHAWGKEYTSVSVDGYDISDYTPVSKPIISILPPLLTFRHFFVNVTLKNDASQLPKLRVIKNVPTLRIWELMAIERPIADLSQPPFSTLLIDDYTVRVKVCDPLIGLEDNCQAYPSGNYKPTGLLQQLGENDSMHFGLLTGSYNNNLEGGVLRKNIGTITDEIDSSTGQLTALVGIIQSIDKLRFTGFGGNYVHDCGSGLTWISSQILSNGQCQMWGNPIGEMIYESLRYFAGKAAPTSQFSTTGGTDGSLGLPAPNWVNPYASPTPYCAKSNILVISDINPSYDSNSVPGSYFNAFSGDLAGFNAASLGQTIWNNEKGAASQHFIGQSATNYDGTPSAKSVSSFGNIRGLAPAEPTKEGSYYSASSAYYGRVNDVNTAQGTQNVHTYVAALSTNPEIKINAGGSTIRLIPIAKTVGNLTGCFLTVNSTQGAFQPTGSLVDLFVESLTASQGEFRVSFEDVEQGGDFDMDALVKYTYVVNGDNTVTITMTNLTAPLGCLVQHIGYVISGTTNDGVHLEMSTFDPIANLPNLDINYFLDSPTISYLIPGASTSKTFSPGASANTLLKNPLWYAAKWGSFNDLDSNNLPSNANEFDIDANGTPDNYFQISNALDLGTQLSLALDKIADSSGSFTPAALSPAALGNDSKLYQAIFKTDAWQGQLLVFTLNAVTGVVETGGAGPNGSLWDAGAKIATLNWNTGRQLISIKPSTGAGVAFRWPSNPASPTSTEIDLTQVSALNTSPITAAQDGLGEARLEFLRGNTSLEKLNGGNFRDRKALLGDIINSAPTLVSSPSFHYPDTFVNGSETPYNIFKNSQLNRDSMIYVGSNDGMMHGFDANTGVEKFAYLPASVFNNLNQLTNPNYTHRYFVDGSPTVVDAYFNGTWNTVLSSGLNAGGQSVFALNVTNPSGFSESFASNIVLWEFDDSDDEDMGYSFSRPSIVRLANGQWAAIFGNGYNNTFADSNVSSSGNAVLYIVNIQTGALIKKFDTKAGMNDDPLNLGRPNGLSSPTIVDTNGDSVADLIYVGDLFGNLWKIDVISSNPNQWGFSFKQGNTPKPLFIAKDASGNEQAITSAPTVSRVDGAFYTLQIYFGTGKYIEGSDKTDMSVQSFYAIQDANDGNAVSGRSELLQQSIVQQANGLRVTSTNVLLASHKGWYLDLIYTGTAEGERIIANPIYQNKKIIFTTIIPSSDVCAFGGTSWLMEMNAQDGRRLFYSPFDLNNDNQFNVADYIVFGVDVVPVSGLLSTVGLFSSPAILNVGEKEIKYLTGTLGGVQTVNENPGSHIHGRQSWREYR